MVQLVDAQYGILECAYITMDHDSITVEAEDTSGEMEHFTIPMDQLLNPSDIDVFSDIMELEVSMTWLESEDAVYDR